MFVRPHRWPKPGLLTVSDCSLSPQLPSQLPAARRPAGQQSLTLAFNLFHFVTSDTFYLGSRVTLCNKREGHPCQPVRGQPWEGGLAVATAYAWRRWGGPLEPDA